MWHQLKKDFGITEEKTGAKKKKEREIKAVSFNTVAFVSCRVRMWV